MMSKSYVFNRYRKYRLFSMAAAGFAIVTGLLVLIGWWLHVPALISIVPGLVTMKPNTATCFVLASIALWLLRSPEKELDQSQRIRRTVAKLFAAVVCLTGLATLTERLFGWNLGIDELLFRQTLLATHVPRPGLMAAATALAFTFLGMSLLLLDWETSHKRRPAQGFALPVVLIGIIALLGYLYGVQLLFGAAGYSVVAVNTGVIFIFLGSGVLAARPDRGLMAVLTSERLGGLLGRRLLPVVICLPVLVGWLHLRGHHARLYTVEFGTALSASSYIVILAFLVWFCAFWLNRLDAERRHAEERDLMLAAIVDSSADAILGKTLDGVITSWNKGAERMYGYREEEVLGKNVTLLAPPDRVDEVARILAELQKDVPIERIETQRKRKDGKIIHVSLAISPIRDRDGRLTGASTVARDITERKQVEERLSQSQAQLQGIIDSAMDAVITVDQEQRILMFNPAAEKMFGYARGEIKGEPLERLIPLRFRPDHEQHVRRFGTTGTTSRAMGALGALNGLRKDGREFPLEASISQVEIEGKKFFTAIVRDVTDRVRTEESLRQSEAQIKGIIDSAMDALITVDTQQQIVMFNPAAEKMFRCSAADALGSPLDRFIPQRFRAAHAQHVRGFGETGTTSRAMGTLGALQGLRADGEEFPIEASISQTISSGKKLYTAIVRDVTERERSEQELRETQEQLRLFVEYAPAAIAMVDNNMNYVAASSRWMADYGIKAGKIVGRNHYEIFPDIPEAWREIHRRCLAGEVASNDADLWTRSDGAAEWIRWEVRPWRKSQGAIGGLIIFSEVITERKRSEEALHLAQSRLLSALEGGRMGTWVWDIGSNQVVWDDAMCSLFGRTAEDLAGGSMEQFFSWLHPQDRERTRAALENAVREGSTYDAEYRLLSRDQSLVWIAARGRVERDPQGHAFRMTGVCIDITDRKKIEEQLLQAQKMESLGTLAGGIAHDFNNILLAIGGNAHLAIEELPPEHPAQTSLREIAKAGTRATNLVRQILSFSRRQTPDRKPVKVQPVVEEALALLRATLPARIEIRSTFAPHMPSILADSTQLHQVIMNLATNAVRAMGEQPGALELTVKPVTITPDFAAPNVKLKTGEYVRLSISDTGCGMDAATQERIFDPFFTTQAPGQGTGLGLSVVHGIMKDHEGSISVYSEPGKGTIFHLYFPAISDGVEAAKVPTAARRGRGQRLLYVDDEEALVLLATRSLGRLGYQVTGETDPVRALQLFRKNPAQFDAVVTDLSMPGMSGSELARQMMEVRPEIPVVMMSGYLRPEDEEEARRIGVRDLILKPDTIEDLAQSLDRLFSAISVEPGGVSKPLSKR